MNDGKAHPNGSVHFGTMDNDERDARGSLCAKQPLAGSLFEVAPGVRGLAPALFGG